MPQHRVTVAVVGAGFAGLGAASTLSRAGTNVVVLEASARLGGRAVTLPFGGVDNDDPVDCSVSAGNFKADFCPAGLTSVGPTPPDASKDCFCMCGMVRAKKTNINPEPLQHVEFGAQWLHGTEGNPLYDVAVHNKLLDSSVTTGLGPTTTAESVASGKAEKESIFLAEDGERISTKDVKDTCGVFKRGMAAVSAPAPIPPPIGTEQLAPIPPPPEDSGSETCSPKTRPQPGESVGEVLRSMWHSSEERGDGTPGHNHREAVWNWREKLETAISGCHSIDELSAHAFPEYEELVGPNLEVGSGYSSIVDAVARSLPEGVVRFNHKVERIRWNPPATTGDEVGQDDGVVLTCDNGEIYHAEYVVVTVSLGVLKSWQERSASRPVFVPELPRWKADAIERMGFGTVDKIFLEYEGPWWSQLSKDGRDDMNLFLCWKERGHTRIHADLGSWVRKTYSFVPRGPKVAVAWITGHEAIDMERQPITAVANEITTALRMFTGVDVPHPIRIMRSQWGTDPLFYGSYSFVPVCSSGNDIDALSRPVHSVSTPNRILFAGEHTHRTYYSTAHGAFLSGIREGSRILDKC